MKRRHLIWCGAFAAILIAAGGVGFYLNTWQNRPFDAAVWRACADHKSAARLAMVDDLQRNHSPVGATRAEIRERLGRPDQTYPDYSIYWLGPESPSVSFEDRWLRLVYKNDVVVSTDIYYD